MRFVNIYLVGYFLLVIGALAALWYGGVLRQISPMWIIIGLVWPRHHAGRLGRQTGDHTRILIGSSVVR